MNNRSFYSGKFIFGIWGLLLFSIVLIENPSIVSAQQHGDLVRMQGDTKIYLIQNGQRRAIASEEVFRQMGFKTEEVKELDPQAVMSIPEGPPLWSKETIAPYPEGTLIRLKGKAQAYVIMGGRKCYIPDPETFQAHGFQWDQVIEVDQSTFNKIPTGIPIASVKPAYQYGQPGMPPPAYPGSPVSPYPPQPYPPSTYPPPSSPSPQPYQYPPPSDSPAPSYPPPSAPPSYPPPPSNSPSAPPPSKPSSRLPLLDNSSVTAWILNFKIQGESIWNLSNEPDFWTNCLTGAKRRLI
jgi:hypothetical protein